MQLNTSLWSVLRSPRTGHDWLRPGIFILLLLAFATWVLLVNKVSMLTVMDTLFTIGQVSCLLFLLIGGSICVIQAMGKGRERGEP